MFPNKSPDFPDANEKWHACGRKVDARFMYFIPYMLACLVALGVAVVGIFTDKEHFNFYSTLLVGTIGYLSPGPAHSVFRPKQRKKEHTVSPPELVQQTSESKTEV